MGKRQGSQRSQGTGRDLGYEVACGSKALYQTVITDPAIKSGTWKISYFGASQVQPISA